MPPNLFGSPSSGIDPHDCRDDANAVLDLAMAIQAGRRTGGLRPLLGRNIGLLCENGSGEMATLELAATRLGARVAQIRLGLADLHEERDLRRIAGVLGQLYDAVVCQGGLPRRLGEICADLRLPLYVDAVCACRQLARLAERLEGEVPIVDKQCLVMQAALIRQFT